MNQTLNFLRTLPGYIPSSIRNEILTHLLAKDQKRSFFGRMLPIGVFGTGLLLGIGLGVMFAPKPGYEIRQDLLEKSKPAKETVKDKSQIMVEKAKNLSESAEDASSAIAEKTQEVKTSEEIQVTGP